MDDALRRAKLSFSAVGRGDDVYFVARNPYTRLLSLYLDKVLRCFRVGERDPTAGGSYCSHDVMAASGAFRYTPRRQPEAPATVTDRLQHASRALRHVRQPRQPKSRAAPRCASSCKTPKRT